MDVKNRVIEDYQIDPLRVIQPVLAGNRPIEGRIAVIAGSSRGLGRAIAVSLAQHGASVVVNHRTSEREAETVCATARAFGAEAIAVNADVRRTDDCERLTDVVLSRYDRIDILVNAVTLRHDRGFHRLPMDDWKDGLDSGLTGAANLIRATINPMRQRGRGRILNIAAVRGNDQDAAEAAAKAGLIGLTRVLARENAEHGITVNCVAPGLIETRDLLRRSEAERQHLSASIPMKRFGRPEDVGDVVRFLASDAASYITGQTIHVNGGLWMP